MNFLKRLEKGLRAFSDEVSKPQSHADGEAFEDYVRKVNFPSDRYKLLHRSHSYTTNNRDYVESSLKPDFLFEDLENNKKFYVEVKWRAGYYNSEDKIEWCKPYQLKRYKEIDKNEHKVFILLGIGENSDDPEQITLFPLSSCNFCALYDSFFDKYLFYPGKPVFSNYLWSLK